MLSFSTCWNSSRHQDGEAMLQEILDLGFERVELGHGIRLSLMEGIQRRFNKGGLTISSLHNFCPLPIEITRAAPDCYQFSSTDARERERALRHTFQTIDFAQRFGARFVVLHLGRTPLDEYTDKLVHMAEVGLINSGRRKALPATVIRSTCRIRCARPARRSRRPGSPGRCRQDPFAAVELIDVAESADDGGLPLRRHGHVRYLRARCSICGRLRRSAFPAAAAAAPRGCAARRSRSSPAWAPPGTRGWSRAATCAHRWTCSRRSPRRCG